MAENDKPLQFESELEAKVWAQFAATELPGHSAQNAAISADLMLLEWRKRAESRLR